MPDTTIDQRPARSLLPTLSTRRFLAAMAAGAVLAGTGVLYSADVHADPTFNVDPHIPNPTVGWCPGGGDGGLGMGYCDGKPYADNTKWHFARGFIPFKGWTSKMDCVINTGELLQPLAGPGGCGGAA
ncbi:hypothetical protein [Mycolicibacterium porcinum]|uniref:Twin-arginine translocation signal domain-containing protein n=1 Tax=Mycolicibacterium porcinum TaxID=39693 RepID=A0ABV3VI36_9MYCO